MSFPFYQSATGDPTGLKRRIAWQSVEGVPATTGFVDFINNGGPLAPDFTTIARQAIYNGFERAPALRGHSDVKDSALSFGDIDPGNKAHLMILANLLQGYRTTSSGAAYLHHLSQVERATTVAPSWLTMLSDANIGLPARWADLRVKGIALNAAKGQNLALKPTLVPGKYDFWGDPMQSSGSGSTAPLLRHTSEALNWVAADASDNNVYIKVTAFNSGTQTATIKVKVSLAATYPSATITVPLGQWVYLTDQNGAVIGNRGEQVAVYFPVAATVVVNDEWNWPFRRPTWTPTYATERPIPEIDVRFYANGVELFTEGGWQLNCTVPGVTRRDGPGQRQGFGTIRTGLMDITLSATRRLISLDLQ